VTTYGEALLAADRKRLKRTAAIGLRQDRLSQGQCGQPPTTPPTVADVENHQIIEILPTRNHAGMARWLDKQPEAWKQRIAFGALDLSATYAVYSDRLAKSSLSTCSPWRIAVSTWCDVESRPSVPFGATRPATRAIGLRPSSSWDDERLD
jgi:hypothetical protein